MIQKVISKDYAPKIVAVILALIVWIQVFNDKNPLERRVFSVEVVPVEVQEGIIIVSMDPTKVNATFEGRSRTLDEVDKNSLRATADLSAASADKFTAELSMTAPYGLKIVEINPKTVDFEMDTLSSALVGVAVSTSGAPHEDFEKGDPVLLTGSVTVSGPKRLVDRVKYVLGSVDIDGAREAVTRLAKLSARDVEGNEVAEVTLEPGEIEITVPLNPLPPSRVVPVQAVIAGTPALGFKTGRVTVSPKQIKVRAEERVLNSLRHISTTPVDVSGQSSTFLHQTSLDLPRGVTSQEGRVVVTVEIVEDVGTQTYEGVIVQLESPPVGYAWEMEPATVGVDLTGRSDILAKIHPDDITVYIDAQGRTEGTSDLVVAYKIKAPEGVDIDTLQVDIKPPRVKLTLTER